MAVRRELLLHPYRGVYVDRAAWREASEPVRFAMRLFATQLVAPDAIGIHSTAAAVSLLPVRRSPDRPEVARPRHLGRLAGAVVRRLDVPPTDAIDVEGLLVTSMPTTGASIAGTSALPDSFITLDAALARGVSLADLRSAAQTLPTASQRGRAMHAVDLADPWSESWLESLSRGRAIEAGLPVPLCNVTLIAERREVRVDLLWADVAVIGEADGKAKYTLRPDVAEAHWQEKQRQEWLQDLGFEVVRWGLREVSADGSTLRRRFERAVARRSGTGWPRGVRAELRRLRGVTPPPRVDDEVRRLQALGVPIVVAPPDRWRRPVSPGSLWTPTSPTCDGRVNRK